MVGMLLQGFLFPLLMPAFYLHYLYFLKASEIKYPTLVDSSSFIPHVVIAGVPILMPEVINGDLSSKGIAFSI
jgi:hypothetical protein